MSLKKYSNGFTHNQLIILGGAGIIVVFFILVFLGVLPGGRDPAAERAQLTFWGVSDTRSTWDDLISDYIEEHPGVSITYRELSSSAYENDLINALAIDEGPDIFMIQNSWLPRYTNKVVPLLPRRFLQAGLMFYIQKLSRVILSITGKCTRCRFRLIRSRFITTKILSITNKLFFLRRRGMSSNFTRLGFENLARAGYFRKPERRVAELAGASTGRLILSVFL